MGLKCGRCGKDNLKGAVKVYVAITDKEEWFCFDCLDECMYVETRQKFPPKY